MAVERKPNTTFRVSMTSLLKPKDAVAVNDAIRADFAECRQLVHKLRDYADLVEATLADLEAHDKLGNFEIQRLMSAFNQMETLASNVQKKRDETAQELLNNIG